jgi:hypothetical protein
MTTPLTVSEKEPIKVIADIIQKELDLDDGLVMIYNQRFKPPTTEGIYIVLSYISGRPIGVSNHVEDAGIYGITEVQESAMNEMIQIDAMSANDEARIRHREIILALGSIYGQQQCDKYLMQMARIPGDFTDVSDLEGAARLNRYTMTMTIKALYRKTKTVEYYGTFTTPEVHTNE